MNKEFIITPEEAKKLLKEGETIHTFRNAGNMIIGEDWDRDDVFKAIDKFSVSESWGIAKSMCHGLVLEDETGYLFIETKI